MKCFNSNAWASYTPVSHLDNVQEEHNPMNEGYRGMCYEHSYILFIQREDWLDS